MKEIIKNINTVEEYKFDKHINDSKEIVEILEKIVREKNQTVLIDAPCGAGKTYVCDYLFEGIKAEYKKSGKKFLNAILCPTRIQNIQNSNEYNFEHLIKESSSRKMEFGLNYSCVYELFSKITDLLLTAHKSGEEFLCNLIIDEAQELLNERNFREGVKALTSQLEMLRSLGIECNIIYLSGTTEGILGIPEDTTSIFKFDRILRLRSTNQEIKAKNLNLYVCSDKQDYYDYFCTVISKQDDCLTHLQSKNGIERVRKTFEGKKKVNTLTSEDKGYTYKTNEDGTELMVVYDNELLQSVTESSKVTKGHNVHTSCMESGTNNNYAPEGFAQNYICLSERDCHIESMVQFLNRTRPVYEDINIFVKEGDIKKKIKTREEVRKALGEKLAAHVERVKGFIEGEKSRSTNNIDLYNNVRSYLEIMTYEGEKAGFRGVISVDEKLDLTIDMLTFESVVYKEYNANYYYNPEALLNKLEQEIKVEKSTIYKGNIEITQKCAKLGKDKIDYKKIALEALDKFTQKDIEKLERVIKNHGDIESDELIKNFLDYRPYKELVKRLLFFGVEINKILKDISKFRGEKTLRKINKKYQKAMYVYLNRRYINSAESKKIDLASVGYEGFYVENGKDYSTCEIEVPESEIVLKNLYIINEAGNLKQTTLTPKLIHNITTQINNYSMKQYKDSDTLELIKNHFWLRNKGDKYVVEGVITEF